MNKQNKDGSLTCIDDGYVYQPHQLGYERYCIHCGLSYDILIKTNSAFYDEREAHMNDTNKYGDLYGMCLECKDHKLCTCGVNKERLITIP